MAALHVDAMGNVTLGDALWFPTTAKVATPVVAAVGRTKVATSTPAAPVDICASAAAARARNNPAAAGLEAQCAAMRAATPVTVSAGKSNAPSIVYGSAPKSTENGGCGPEPARKAANASGSAQFANGAEGIAWLACMDRVAAQKQAAAFDALERHALGGPNGCGSEPPFNLNAAGVKIYSGDGGRELGAKWQQCMASGASGATPPPAPVGQGPYAPPDAPPPIAIPGSSGGSAAPDPIAKPNAPDTQKAPAPAPASPASSTGLFVGIGAAALAAGVGLYFALR